MLDRTPKGTPSPAREAPPLHHASTGIVSFAMAPICNDLDGLDADVAVLGVPYENVMGQGGTRLGPRGIREASTGAQIEINRGYFSPEKDEYYFGPPWKVVDCSDVPISGADVEPSFTHVREYVRKIARSDALLVVLGGDHAVTTPVLEGLEARGPFGIVHIDAHMDWVGAPDRPFGHETPMRRASEMKHVQGMAQLGIRSFVYTSREDYQDALDYGSVVLTPRKMRELGTAGVIAQIPKCERYYVSIDIDGMDPSIAPGTGAVAHGGLLYDETRDLLEGVAGLGEIVGFDLVEVSPPLDPSGITSRLASRLILDFLAYILKQRERRGDLPQRDAQ